MVNDPSDQRSILAFDCISPGFRGEYLHLIVLFDVWYEEKVEEAGPEEW
jgi:hypothetical protein